MAWQRGRLFSAAAMEPIWITGEEYFELTDFADLNIIHAYECDGWKN
jgi:hypothetical protein